MILLKLGTNFFFGEVSYITKALSAVLREAMSIAIKETLTSVVGSSVTTVAGFVALCFMSFTLGKT